MLRRSNPFRALLLCCTVCCAWSIPGALRAADDRHTLAVWPGDAPGETGDIGDEQVQPPEGERPVTRITNVTRPMLTVFEPPADRRTGTAVIVCPGGGYNILAWSAGGARREPMTGGRLSPASGDGWRATEKVAELARVWPKSGDFGYTKSQP